MSHRRLACLTLVLAAGLLSAREPLRIGVSIFPLKSMVEAIAGGEGEVFCAIPAGANPHLFEPTPSLLLRLREAAVVFGITPEFDGWMDRFRPPSSPVRYLKPDAKGAGDNPHVWLSLRLALEMAKGIARELAQARPAGREEFLKNFGRFASELGKLDREVARILAPHAGCRFLLWHPSWNYFAADYGLQIAGVIESGRGDEPSVRDFQKLALRAKREGVRLVVIDLNVQGRTAQTLAREIGGALLRLDALGDPERPERSDYLKLMEWNARQLAAALRTHPCR